MHAYIFGVVIAEESEHNIPSLVALSIIKLKDSDANIGFIFVDKLVASA
jgi:hypothetical protein